MKIKISAFLPNDDEKRFYLIRELTADCLTLYVRISAIHYLIIGSTFDDLHKLTEMYYKTFQEMYDFLNERLVQLQQKPLTSLKDVDFYSKLELQEIKSSYLPYEACKELVSYLEQIKILINSIISATSIYPKDSVTNDYCIKQLYFIDKQLWQLNSRIKNS